MRSPYPTPEAYRHIYAKYYQGRSIEELCLLLGSINNKYCLDLCSGEGLATEFFVRHGASCIWTVDESALMIDEAKKKCPTASTHCLSVQDALVLANQSEVQFDKVLCRQGINYWLTPTAVQLLSKCMKTGSIFVFNTFNQKVSVFPRVRTYVHNGRSYGEVAYSVGDVIHTVVACDGYEPHQSEILWLSRELLHTLLEPHYKVTELVDGNSSVYVCVLL